MTTEQRVQWVALPAGASDDGYLKLSVFVAPRLRSDTGTTLARYPDFVDWPAIVGATTWQVTSGGDPDLAVDAEVAGAAPDSALWAALFPTDTRVTPYEFDDYADRPLVTYGVGAVVDSLRSLYAEAAAASPDELPRRRSVRGQEPPITGLDHLLTELGGIVDGRLWRVASDEEGREQVAALLADARRRSHARRAGAARGQPDPIEPIPVGGSEYERALFFHSRPDAEPKPMPADGVHYRDLVDFHQSVSALGDHPDLLRRLGLVVDLRVSADALPPAPPAAPGVVRVLPTLPDLPAELAGEVSRVAVTHDTAYVLVDVPDEGTVFAAAPRVPDPLGPVGGVPTGLVPLPETSFRLEQLDVDGAVLKALDLAATIYLSASGESDHPLHQPDSAGLPALRSSGLALVQTGRAAALQGELAQGLSTNAATENAVPALLYAEDLVLGHRLDVFDASIARWRSTSARIEAVAAQRYAGVLDPHVGEGFGQLSLAGALTPPGAAPDPDGELYVHEAVLTWDGWSLTAPRPGASLSRDPRAPDPDVPESQPVRVVNDPHTSMGLSFAASVTPGTLPRLRFGRSYRIRLRSVDLAGNGTTMADADRWLASPAAATPALPARTSSPYLRFEPVPAPAVVPATAYGEGASLLRLVIRSNGEGAAAWVEAFNAEHGEGAPEPHAPYDEHDERHLAPPKASFELAERHAMFDLVMGADGVPDQARRDEIAAAYEVARREKGSFGDPDAPGAEVVVIEARPPTVGEPPAEAAPQRYVIYRTPQLELPYLPDPLAVGTVLFGLPGRVEPEPLRLGFDGAAWYQRRPLRLRLADGDGAPSWDADGRVLTVSLPAATRATIRVASQLDAIDQMALLAWCEQELTGEKLDRVVMAISENRSWLTTPWHTVDLVHAVQQPLWAPEVQRFVVRRDSGAPHANLSGMVAVEMASTEKIDVLAEWTEPVDDPASPGPAELRSATAIFDLAVATAALVPRSDPGEEAYCLVDDKLLAFNTAMRAGAGRPPGPTAHHFGDTKHRLVTYTVRATSAFREYFPLDWAAHPERLSRDSAPMVVHVPASAPPASPALLYAVPTLRWEERGTPDTTVSVRGGGGVRVWLDRGWWSSGADEQLGVVIGPYLSDASEPVHHLMTFVGQDMTRGGGKVASPDEDTFPNCTGIVRNVTLLEGPKLLRLATFDPVFDPGSGRWFCDIDVVTDSAYLPILRLALVRYQPYAIDGASVSRVVLVDIVQTLPDRTLTVSQVPGDPALRAVTVVGPSYTSLAGLGAPRSDPSVLARVTCRVQQRLADGPADELAWQDAGPDLVELAAAFDGPVATWSGRVAVPEQADDIVHRLLVVEEDQLPVDEQTPSRDGFLGRVTYAATVEF